MSSIDLNQCDQACHDCIANYVKKHSLKRGEKFLTPCTGIPKTYVPAGVAESSGIDISMANAMLDPVSWAAKFLDWHCLDPDGEHWKRKTEDGSLPTGLMQYSPEQAKLGKSVFHRPYQSVMLECTSKRKVFRLGRQAGKTTALCIAILHNIFTHNNFRVVVIAPYQSQIDLIFKVLNEFINSNSILENSISRNVKAPQYQVQLKNGSMVTGFTAGTRSGQDAGASRGQCLAKGTRVRMASGLDKNIEDIKTGDMVLSYGSDWKSVVAKVTHVFQPNTKEIVRLTTKTGRTISASWDHSFFTQIGEAKLSELAVGDHIAIPEKDYENKESFDLIGQEIVFDEIREIKALGVEETYDIEVASTQKFIANNIVVHNSAHMLVFDEADYLSSGDIDAALAIITNFPDATVWMSSTPTGRRERFYETCRSKLFREFHYPSYVNPNWTEELDALYRENLTEDGYKHEIEGEFGEQEEGVYQARYVGVAQSEYTYSSMTPQHSWTYMIGVDWNDIKIGTTIAVTGFNPTDGMFYLVDKHVMPRSERTQLAACQKIAEMNRLWQPDYIYVDKGFGCVRKDTLIQTELGCSKIQDIQTGDRVLTSGGRYKKVVKKVSVEPKPCYLIRPSKCLPTTLSDSHPLLIYKTEDRFNDDFININKLQWCKARDIDPVLDFVAIPKQKQTKQKSFIIDVLEYIDRDNIEYDERYVWSKSSGKQRNIGSLSELSRYANCSIPTISRIIRKQKEGLELNSNQQRIYQRLSSLHGEYWWKQDPSRCLRFIDLADNDFQCLLGWYLAEGNLNKNSVELLQKKELYMKEFLLLQGYAEKYFDSSVLYSSQKGNRLFINNCIVRDLFEKLCGRYAQYKKIHPVFKKVNCASLIRSIVYGDGHSIEGEPNSNVSGIQLSMTSMSLVMSIRQLFINEGILPSLHLVPKGKVGYQNQLRIDISGNQDVIDRLNNFLGTRYSSSSRTNRRKYVEIPDYLLVPIKEFKKDKICDKLYDIEVEDDESFVGNGFVLHNTTQVEILHKFGFDSLKSEGPNSSNARLRNIVKAFDFGGNVEITDLFTHEKMPKKAKPFLVENSVRRFETCSFKYPEEDEKFTKALLGYIVCRVSQSGQPVYEQQDTTVGDHFLDAVNLSLVAFTLEKSDFSKVKYENQIAFSAEMGQMLSGGGHAQAIRERERLAPKGGRASGPDDNKLLPSAEGDLPIANNNDNDSVRLWAWPGFGHDAPRPAGRSLGEAFSQARGRSPGRRSTNRPKRKNI